MSLANKLRNKVSLANKLAHKRKVSLKMTTLKYEYTVKNFTCEECGEFSDELSNITTDISDTTITALCCDTEYWVYDLNQLGYDVEEVIR